MPPSPSPPPGARPRAEGRPGHSRSSCSSLKGGGLSVSPRPRSTVSPESVLPLSPPALQRPPPLPGSAPTFSFSSAPATGSWLRGGAPLTPPPGDLGLDLRRAAAGRACAQGTRAPERGKRLCEAFPSRSLSRRWCSRLLLGRAARACRGEACHLPGVCDIPSAPSCCGSSRNRTARRAEDDLPP